MKRSSLLLPFAALLLSAGCASQIGLVQDVDADVAASGQSVRDAQSQLPDGKRKPLLYTSVSNEMWMGAVKRKVEKREVLPPAFSADVTLVFNDKVNIATVAERITRVTGIPVKIRPDVFLSAQALVGSSQGGQPANAALPSVVPMPAALSQSVSTNADYSLDFNLNYPAGPLSGLLDQIATKAGINWEYQDGAVVLYRMVTKTWTLKSTPGTSRMQASIGKQLGSEVSSGADSTGGTSGSFSANSTVEMGSAFSVWESLKAQLDAIRTPLGKPSVNESAGTVTLTDTREVIEQADRIIAHMNAELTRQVSFRVEVLSVELNDTAEYGVNWNAVFEHIRNASPSWGLVANAPQSLVSGDAAGIGYSILTSPTVGADGSRGFRPSASGSEAMLQALAGQGKASVVTTASAVTLNRQPVPIAITEQVSYVASITTQASTTAGVPPTTEINPATVTTGFILNLLPAVGEDGRILLQMALDISTLKSLTTFGTGSAQVQSPSVSGMQFMQQVGLKNGETLVLTGFERTTGQYDERGLSRGAPLLAGGSVNGKKKRESLVILVTPVVASGE